MPSRARRTFAWIWNAVDRSRRVVVNVLFLVIVVACLYSLLSGHKAKIADGAALVVAPKGELVEQVGRTSNVGLAQQALSDERDKQTLLRDLVDALASAKTDAKISSVYLDLSELGGSGMTTLEDLRAALLDFKTSGKKIIAYCDNYTQGQYYVATVADEIWLSPIGSVTFEGLSRYQSFFKDALDRLEVDVHVFRVGEYKSAVEPFLRNDASPESKQADLAWMSQLWGAWLRDVGKARGRTPDELSDSITHNAERMEAVKGDTAKLAVNEKLVDKLGYRDEVNDRMIALAGEDADNKKERTYRHVSVKDYLASLGGDRDGKLGSGDAVAVIVASGEIHDGRRGPGSIGGDSLAELIRKTSHDKKVKAIVLRVDSPGGSAFASEVIRRELVLARKAGIKVVVSMGALAASGGYWISTASDEIWASPETITGSIGIFGIIPTADRALAHFLGVHSDGVATTPLAGQPSPQRPLSPEVARVMQAGIDHGYQMFIDRVAESRKMSAADVDKIARGRVWSGADGLRLHLVDKLGGEKDAIASAGKLAGLGDGFRVTWPSPERKFFDKLLESYFDDEARAALGLEATTRPSELEQQLAAQLRGLADLASWNDPNHAYAYCACDVR